MNVDKMNDHYTYLKDSKNINDVAMIMKWTHTGYKIIAQLPSKIVEMHEDKFVNKLICRCENGEFYLIDKHMPVKIVGIDGKDVYGENDG